MGPSRQGERNGITLESLVWAIIHTDCVFQDGRLLIGAREAGVVTLGKLLASGSSASHLPTSPPHICEPAPRLPLQDSHPGVLRQAGVMRGPHTWPHVERRPPHRSPGRATCTDLCSPHAWGAAAQRSGYQAAHRRHLGLRSWGFSWWHV